MSRSAMWTTLVPVAATLALFTPQTASAQAGGAFERAYPEAAGALDSFDASRAALRARLVAGSGQLSGGDHAALVAALRLEAAPPAAPGATAELAAILERGRELQLAILDAYTAEGVADPYTRVEQLVDEYLRDSGATLPAEPLTQDVFAVVDGGMPAGHGGHGAHAMHGAGDMPMDHSFSGMHADLARLLRAQQWLELALFEPVLLLRGAEEAEGVREVLARYEERRDEEPGTRLSAMPTPAAIAPELTMVHPRAAIILNHLHMLENAALDLIATQGAGAPAAVAQLVADVASPGEPTTTPYQWLLLTLRRGIYAQGGPALGTLDRLDRNVGSPGDHRVQTGIIH